jgi:hypothetical protein
MTQTQRNYQNFETLKEALGAETLLSELMHAMSSKEASENLEHIAAMHDVSIEGQDNED